MKSSTLKFYRREQLISMNNKNNDELMIVVKMKSILYLLTSILLTSILVSSILVSRYSIDFILTTIINSSLFLLFMLISCSLL